MPPSHNPQEAIPRGLQIQIRGKLTKLMENNMGECLCDLEVEFTTLKLRTSVHPKTPEDECKSKSEEDTCRM